MNDDQQHYFYRLRKQSEFHALYWYDRCDTEHEKQDCEAIFGEVLETALAKRKQSTRLLTRPNNGSIMSI